MKTYTTFETAKILHVANSTLIKWCNRSKIKSYRTIGGHRRIQHGEILRFLIEHQFPIPENF